MQLDINLLLQRRDALKKELAAVEDQITATRDIERASVIEKIKATIEAYQIPPKVIARLVSDPNAWKKQNKRRLANAKYRNPKTGATWSGKGRQPRWITEATDRTEFLIRK